MPTSKRRLVLAAAASLLTPAGSALAHDDKKHPAKTGPVRKEQTDWGIAGDAKKAKRSIDVGMADNIRFTPGRIAVKLGETVRFVARNKGKVMHEFVIGTKSENEKHAALMVKFPDMEPRRAIHDPRAEWQDGQIVWTFNRAGEFEFACLIAGHYEAGMVGQVSVLAN